MNVYCIRAGKNNLNIDYFLENKCVNIDYGINFDLSDSDIDIYKFLSNDSNKNQVAQYISQINIFKKIKKNDIILSPSNTDINVGRVISSIFLKDFKNTISVEWIKKIKKNTIINLPKTVFKIQNFDLDNLDFINDENRITFLEATRIVLEKNLNEPMTSTEIWNKISEMKLMSSYGKTPKRSLNMILHKSDLFITIKESPASKFIYKRYVSNSVKESLIENGFITEERLFEILFEKFGK